ASPPLVSGIASVLGRAAIVVTPGAQALAQKAQAAKSNAASRANASVPMSRDEAIQKCNAEAAKWSNRDFQSTQAAVYGDCMIAATASRLNSLTCRSRSACPGLSGHSPDRSESRSKSHFCGSSFFRV